MTDKKKTKLIRINLLDVWYYFRFCVYALFLPEAKVKTRKEREIKYLRSLLCLLLRCCGKSRLLIIKVDNFARSFSVDYNCGGDCFFARVPQFRALSRKANTLFIFTSLSFPLSSWFALQLPFSGSSRFVNNLTSALVDHVLN